MNKYQEALDAGFTDEQILEYLKPKIEQATQSVGQDQTKAYMLSNMGLPENLVNNYFKPTEQQAETVPFVSVPKQIKKYIAEGKEKEEATSLAMKDYYHSKGMPAAEAGEQFTEHIAQPFKEGIATVGVGFVSLVDDIMSGLGINDEDVSKNLETVRQDLKQREKDYEETYGADVVREVSKKIPAVLAAVANPTSLTGLAATETPLAYAETRGGGGTVGEATTSAAITAAIPAAFGLGKAVHTIVKYPAQKKSQILQTVSEQAKQDMFEVLKYAEEKGVVLTPSQLTDNKTINQLTDLVSRTPAVANKFATINDNNKALLMEAYINLKQGLSAEDVSSAFIKGEVDPFGREIQSTLKDALNLRKSRINEAYSTFEDLASDINIPPEAKQTMIKSLNEIKEWGQKSNNPEGVAALVDDAVKRVQGKVTEPAENALTKLFNASDKSIEETASSTLADLNDLSKQLYKQGKNIQDPTLKSVWENTRRVINDQMTKLADSETLDALNVARSQHIAKEKLYGLKPDFKAIANAATVEQTEDIVNSLLKSKTARSNAAALKKEFALAGRPEMSKALAKRYMEDNITSNVKEFKDIGKFDIKDVIKGYSKMDPEVVKLLAGESAAKELRMLAKLAKSTESLDKLVTYTPMTGAAPNMISVAIDYVKGAIQNKILGDTLSSDLAMKGLLKIWSKEIPARQKMDTAKEMARAAGLSEGIYKPKPASETIGAEARRVFRTSFKEGEITRGPLGKGTYYTLDEAKATKLMEGTKRQIHSMDIFPDDIATMDTVSEIIGKKSTFKDITPQMIEELKLRGFTGLMDEGDMVIFNSK